MTYLPGHDGKATSDKKTISTFETTGKFVIVFVRLILGKVGVDVFTGL